MGSLNPTGVLWRRSSHSGGTGGECVECAPLDGVTWRKSSHSADTGGDCVEVAELPAPHIAIRDSKRPDGPRLTVSAPAFTALVSTL
ncbi:DUF397 domain-containing protein [Streptomyces sp. NRRL B-1347]|uniref:DUF397 domain-containing protein n=1 Tax=Streptomyces sp. NRRL B-1347 TaxID=1476877 RepID=UPI00099DF38A|nr:DUF397 domain-containing protein [Streptomyces sp. NRRL B-1347]